jgi:hypothetical protein
MMDDGLLGERFNKPNRLETMRSGASRKQRSASAANFTSSAPYAFEKLKLLAGSIVSPAVIYWHQHKFCNP